MCDRILDFRRRKGSSYVAFPVREPAAFSGGYQLVQVAVDGGAI